MLRRQRRIAVLSVCFFFLAASPGKALDVAVPFVEADFLWAKGYTGAGVEIGVLDVFEADGSHPALSGNFLGAINFAGGGSLLGSHATEVAGAALSQDAQYTGVAPGAGLWSGQTAKRSSFTSIRTQTVAAETFGQGVGQLGGNPVEVISLSIGINGSTAGTDQWSLALDHIVSTEGRVVTIAAGNSGPAPGTLDGLPTGAYNAIVVGATGGTGGVISENYAAMAYYSSRGPTIDGRAKPDIVAPGSLIHLPTLDGAWTTASGTSFATPIVAGGAALLIDMGRDLGHATDPKVIKSILLNSADKLGGWTHTPTSPLDASQGAGQMNLRNAYYQYLPAEQAPGTAAAVGWDLGELPDSSEVLYSIGAEVAAGKIISATLDWDRIVSTDTEDIETATYSLARFSNLDLHLYNADDLTTPLVSSISDVDNVEHLYYTVDEPGRYVIGVEMAEGLPSVMEPYGLAWSVMTDLYSPLILGDLDGDGAVNNNDITPFVLALTDLPAYHALYGLYGEAAGDIDQDGALNNNDITPFVALLTGGTAVPEPASLAALGLGGLALIRRRRP